MTDLQNDGLLPFSESKRNVTFHERENEANLIHPNNPANMSLKRL